MSWFLFSEEKGIEEELSLFGLSSYVYFYFNFCN